MISISTDNDGSSHMPSYMDVKKLLFGLNESIVHA
jgi:hypothetical protein